MSFALGKIAVTGLKDVAVEGFEKAGAKFLVGDAAKGLEKSRPPKSLARMIGADAESTGVKGQADKLFSGESQHIEKSALSKAGDVLGAGMNGLFAYQMIRPMLPGRSNGTQATAAATLPDASASNMAYPLSAQLPLLTPMTNFGDVSSYSS